MIVIQKIIFANGPHVSADALAGVTIELLQCDSLPFRRSLYHLRIDGILAAIVRDVELNGRPGTVAVEHVIDPALAIDDQRNLHHHQAKFFAEIVLDPTAKLKECFLGFPRCQKRSVVCGKDLIEFCVISDARAGEVGFLTGHGVLGAV